MSFVAETVDADEVLVSIADHIARGVRTGLGLSVAMDVALAVHPGTLPDIARARTAGCSLAQAIQSANNRGPRGLTRDEQVIVHALQACQRTGGHTVAALDRAGTVLRERRAWKLERRAQSAQARLSALVLTGLPVVVAAWGLLSSDQVRDAYSGTPFTFVTSGIGLLCNAVGWRWMSRLVSSGAR